jgi:hypothetical protein
MESEESPVKVPTSTACRTLLSDVSNRRKAACSGATCMPASSGSTARVSAMSSAVTSSGGVLWRSR